jgi:hypothetical protein
MQFLDTVSITHEHVNGFSGRRSVTTAELKIENPLEWRANHGEPVNWGVARFARGSIRSNRHADARAIDEAQLEIISIALRGLRLGFAPLASPGLYCDGGTDSLKIECGDWCLQVSWGSSPPENFIGIKQLRQALAGS